MCSSKLIVTLCAVASLSGCQMGHQRFEREPLLRPPSSALSGKKLLPEVVFKMGKSHATITIAEVPRPRYVFSEGSFRALRLRRDSVTEFYPDISAGQKTFVEVRQCSGEALLLDDRARERREFILDLASRALLLRFRLSGELYTHLIAAQPCDSIDECIGIAVTAVVPIVPPPSTNLVVHEERAKTLLARKEHRGDGTPLEGEWGHV